MVSESGLMVLSIDGLSQEILSRMIQEGYMPFLGKLIERHGTPRAMLSEQPPLSCVAWSSYATGCNPGRHGVFGFVDRKPGSYRLTFPNSRNLCEETLWKILSKNGKKVFVMNVPCTYPPQKVNGVLIGGFLAPSLSRIAYPHGIGLHLQAKDYQIDVDPMLGHEAKEILVRRLSDVLHRRCEVAEHFLQQDDWDYFHVHIMGTDRINHFLLRQYEGGNSHLSEQFCAFYREVDTVVHRLIQLAGPQVPLLILSDHGFCTIRSEVQLFPYLCKNGLASPGSGNIGEINFDPQNSKAFCLTPGRIYINLKGREKDGCVSQDEYEDIRKKLTECLLSLSDDQGRSVIRKVLPREKIYWPRKTEVWGDKDFPADLQPFSAAPDLIAVSHDGFDLKAGSENDKLFCRTAREGMHTQTGAVCWSRGMELPKGELRIRYVAKAILDHFQITPAIPMDPVSPWSPDELDRKGL